MNELDSYEVISEEKVKQLESYFLELVNGPSGAMRRGLLMFLTRSFAQLKGELQEMDKEALLSLAESGRDHIDGLSHLLALLELAQARLCCCLEDIEAGDSE